MEIEEESHGTSPMKDKVIPSESKKNVLQLHKLSPPPSPSKKNEGANMLMMKNGQVSKESQKI